MGERVNPISVRSKRRISDALLELMQVTPFSKISIKDVVDRAGLTRQTFYHNFETKEDVLLCRIDEHIEGFLQYLSKKKVQNWEDVICCFFRYWQEHSDFVLLLLKNDLIYLLSMRMPHFFQPVREAHFSKTDLTDAEARLWFAFVSGGLVSILTSWLESSGGISARALSKMTIAMMDGSMLERNHLSGEENVGTIIDYMRTEASDETEKH